MALSPPSRTLASALPRREGGAYDAQAGGGRGVTEQRPVARAQGEPAKTGAEVRGVSVGSQPHRVDGGMQRVRVPPLTVLQLPQQVEVDIPQRMLHQGVGEGLADQQPGGGGDPWGAPAPHSKQRPQVARRPPAPEASPAVRVARLDLPNTVWHDNVV